MTPMAILALNKVSKSYGAGAGRVDVLKDVSLAIEEGEFVAIVGFSGSGKTTLMSLMAGLIRPDSGDVLFRDAAVTEPGPERGLVFQSYALMPWLTVEATLPSRSMPPCGAPSASSGRRASGTMSIWSDYLMPSTGARRSCPAACASGWRWRVPWR